MNDVNPFQSPETEAHAAVGVLSGRREDVRSVAQNQKGVLICILISIILLVFQFVLPPRPP